MTINRSWLTRIVKVIPAPYVKMEAVRIGQNVKDYVRLTILGVDCGIWLF